MIEQVVWCVLLQSYSWESGVCEEMVPVHWGKVADIAISGEQLVSTAPCTVPLFIECSSVCESFVASGSDPTDG